MAKKQTNEKIVTESLKNEKLNIRKRRSKTLLILLCTLIPLAVIGLSLGLVFGLGTSYKITTTAGENGTVVVTSDDMNMKTEDNVYTISGGKTATVTITPDTGYSIATITLDDEEIDITAEEGQSQTIIFEKLDKEHTISATFGIRTFTVTFKDYDGTELKTQVVNYNTDATPPADPSRSGYRFTSWEGIYTNVTNNVTITATYIQQFTITVGEVTNGTILPNTTQILDNGESQEFTITADTGYYISAILVDGVSQNITNNLSQTYAFNNIAGDHTISAEFTLMSFGVTITQVTGGTVQANATTPNYGADITFTITPNAAYYVTGYILNGETHNVNTNYATTAYQYTFENVQGNVTFQAIFTMRTYSITTAAGSNGIITPNNPTVNYGGNQSFTITPNAGYYIESITIDGTTSITVTGLNGDSQVYEFTNVTSDRTISATFAVKSSEYSVTNGGEASYIGLNTVTTIVIPEKVNGVTVNSFDTTTIPTMTNLEEITVDEDNSAYSSSDGALYDKNLTTLIIVPVAKDSITFPNTLTIIGEKAFENSKMLEVILPSTVQTVSNNAFSNSSIQTLSVTSNETTPTTLSAEALADMTSLSTINVTNNLSNSYTLPEATDGTYTYDWLYENNTVTTLQSAGNYSVSTIPNGYVVAPEGVKEDHGDGSPLWEYRGKRIVRSPAGTGTLLIPAILSTPDGDINISGVEIYAEDGAGVASGYTQVILSYGIQDIGRMAFKCNSLNSIVIPQSVTSIGYQAFCGCSNLTSIIIPSSIRSIDQSAFINCALSSITINGDVTWLNGGGLNCSSVRILTIGAGVTTIGNVLTPQGQSIVANPFANCGNLTAINVDVDNINYSSIDGVLFNKDGTTLIEYPVGKMGSYTIPASVTSIGDSAFANCYSLTSITIPNSVTSIGDNAFRGCSSLTSVTIPDSVTSIGDNAFRGCSSLTSITIDGDVTSLGSMPFYDSTNLKTLNIGANVTNLPSDLFLFASLEIVKIINIDPLNTTYEVKTTETNGYGLYLKNSEILVKSLDETIISVNDIIYQISGTSGNYTATVIGYNTTSITIASNVNYKGETVPVTTIGNRAFIYSRLTSITILSSVISIGGSAFEGCSNLTSITIDSSTIAGLSSSSSNLLTYATTVYVKDTITPVGAYITNSFHTTESDRTGYVKYIKNS